MSCTIVLAEVARPVQALDDPSAVLPVVFPSTSRLVFRSFVTWHSTCDGTSSGTTGAGRRDPSGASVTSTWRP